MVKIEKMPFFQNHRNTGFYSKESFSVLRPAGQQRTIDQFPKHHLNGVNGVTGVTESHILTDIYCHMTLNCYQNGQICKTGDNKKRMNKKAK